MSNISDINIYYYHSDMDSETSFEQEIIYLQDDTPIENIDDIIQINLYFPYNNSITKIQINKHAHVQNIQNFLEDNNMFNNFVLFNGSELKDGTFVENNIVNESKITIMPRMKSGKSIIKKNDSIIIIGNIIMKEPTENEKFNIDLIKELCSPIEEEFSEKKEYNREDLENIGKKFKMAMDEEIKKYDENEKLKKKINDLKERMKKSKNKKNAITEKKETFGGFKKGFLL